MQLIKKNIASCTSKAISNNIISVNDLKCDVANISDIKQKALSKSIMQCSIDQKLVSEISNKIVNKIDKNFKRMYDAAKDDDSKKKIIALSQAVEEVMMNAAGMPPIVSQASENSNKKSDNTNSGNKNSDNDNNRTRPAPTVNLNDDSSNEDLLAKAAAAKAAAAKAAAAKAAAKAATAKLLRQKLQPQKQLLKKKK